MKNLVYIIFLSSLFACNYDKAEKEVEPETGYPADVANILVNKCATSGCHNAQSRGAAAWLDFSTWDVMFEGGVNGTSVIPYSTDYSFMLYTVNTDSTRGPVLLPRMPYLQDPLSESEYETLYNWINNGAPDKNGHVKFSDDPQRKKIYICMQGCDKVAVLDKKSKVIMRYINVGVDPGVIEAPHQVRVSPDGRYWYVAFYFGRYFQKYDAATDSLIASVDIGQLSWNTITFTHDGNTAYVNSLTTDGVNPSTAVVDLTTMTKTGGFTISNSHGGMISPDGNYFYVTSQYGNTIHKINLHSAPFYDDETVLTLDGNPPTTANTLDPHEIYPSPDNTKYFVSCQHSNEVRVFKMSNDSLLAVIPVGQFPQEFSASATHPYLFVTCTEDILSPTQHGKVYVIDYNSLTVVTSLYTGFQPHGIAVDDDDNVVYVANLNYDSNGPAPHHVSACGGRNGNLTIIDMNTSPMRLYNRVFSDGNTIQYKNELLAFPYYVSVRN